MIAQTTCLTNREWEVLGLIAQGREYAEVATVLCISPYTVQTHARHIRQKLSARSSANAVYLAMVPTSCG